MYRERTNVSPFNLAQLVRCICSIFFMGPRTRPYMRFSYGPKLCLHSRGCCVPPHHSHFFQVSFKRPDSFTGIHRRVSPKLFGIFIVSATHCFKGTTSSPFVEIELKMTIQESNDIFDNAQRTKKPTLPWSTWLVRQFCFLTIKFAFCFAFYTLHYQSHQIENPPTNPSLQGHLTEFRQTSRTSQHELTLQAKVRSRKLTESSNKEEESESSRHSFIWEPLKSQCGAYDLIDPFPDSFDSVFYRANYNEDYNHYSAYGRENGLICTRGQRMRDIIGTEIIPLLPDNVLEIGPFINPLIRNTAGSTKIRYFDIMHWESAKKVAEELNYVVSPDPIQVDYVAPSGDLSAIAREEEKVNFSMVVSSNVIGVQLDLVRHLQQVESLLLEGGYYTILVRYIWGLDSNEQDKRLRYCRSHTQNTILLF